MHCGQRRGGAAGRILIAERQKPMSYQWEPKADAFFRKNNLTIDRKWLL